MEGLPGIRCGTRQLQRANPNSGRRDHRGCREARLASPRRQAGRCSRSMFPAPFTLRSCCALREHSLRIVTRPPYQRSGDSGRQQRDRHYLPDAANVAERTSSQQVARPVHWTASIEYMLERRRRHVRRNRPRPDALRAMLKRMAPEATAINIDSVEALGGT